MGNPNFEFIEQKYFSKARRILSKEAGGYFEITKLEKLAEDLFLVEWNNSRYDFGHSGIISIDRVACSVDVSMKDPIEHTEEIKEISNELEKLKAEYEERRNVLMQKRAEEYDKAYDESVKKTARRLVERQNKKRDKQGEIK